MEGRESVCACLLAGTQGGRGREAAVRTPMRASEKKGATDRSLPRPAAFPQPCGWHSPIGDRLVKKGGDTEAGAPGSEGTMFFCSTLASTHTL